MDFATLLGLLGGIAVIVAAIASGSDVSIFINPQGFMIVLGGTLAATLIKFSLSHVISAFRVAFKAFRYEFDRPEDLIAKANSLAELVRRNGVLALDGEQTGNEFFQKGIQLAVDGHPPEFVDHALKADMRLSAERHEVGQRIFRAIGESAPAFGMIGTLVGLVQMLVNMSDPDALGPAMAVALLTTLYGALIAHLLALPIADKLELRGLQERINHSLIIDSMNAIQQGQHPRLMDELLSAYLPHRERAKLYERIETARHGRPVDEAPE